MNRLKQLVVELHRRSLWQVLGIYAIGSWMTYQVILALTEGLGLPSWVPGVAIVLILIGLPVVLATAFVQEGLPARDALKGAGMPSDTIDPTLFPAAVTADLTTARPADLPSSVAASATRDARHRLGRALTWKRALAGGVVAFALLGFGTTSWLGMRALGIGPMGSLVAAGVLDPSARVLIADFEGRGADTTLAGVVTEAFRIDFARSTLVRTVEPTELRDVLRRMQRTGVSRIDAELAREIALRAGIGAFVTGDVAAAGSSFVLTARLIAAESGEVLAAFRERARDDDDVIGAIDRLSRAMRQRTGESLKAIRRSQPLEQVTTSSLEALQKYTQALRISSWEGDPPRAFPLLEEAVALDSAFASAHRAIAIFWSNSGEPARALTAVERALRFEDRMTDIERALAYGTYHSIRLEHAKSTEAYERVLQLDPRHFTALNNLGIQYEHIGDYERAEVYLRRAVESDTSRFFGYTNLGELLVMRGRFEEARQALEAGIARAPASGWAVTDLAIMPYAAGDVAAAETNLRGLLDAPATNRITRHVADTYLVSLLLVRGRLAEAERRMEAFARASGESGGERRLAAHRFYVDMHVLDRPERARAMLAGFRRQHGTALVNDTSAMVEFAAACAWTGDLPCARDYVARAGYNRTLPPWTGTSVYGAAAAIALAEGDPAAAIRHYRAMRDRRCPRCEDAFVGHVFDRMQQPDSAIAAYERYLAAPSLGRIFADAYVLGGVLERLGELYEQRNDRAIAARLYTRLAELWRDADPELQSRVAEARRRVASLQPDR